MAETELSVVAGQCLDRRMDSAAFVTTEVAAWEEERNRLEAKVRWQYHFQGGALILSGQRKIKEGKEIRATERA
jgi:hypothetical protein